MGSLFRKLLTSAARWVGREGVEEAAEKAVQETVEATARESAGTAGGRIVGSMDEVLEVTANASDDVVASATREGAEAATREGAEETAEAGVRLTGRATRRSARSVYRNKEMTFAEKLEDLATQGTESSQHYIDRLLHRARAGFSDARFTGETIQSLNGKVSEDVLTSLRQIRASQTASGLRGLGTSTSRFFSRMGYRIRHPIESLSARGTASYARAHPVQAGAAVVTGLAVDGAVTDGTVTGFLGKTGMWAAKTGLKAVVGTIGLVFPSVARTLWNAAPSVLTTGASALQNAGQAARRGIGEAAEVAGWDPDAAIDTVSTVLGYMPVIGGANRYLARHIREDGGPQSPYYTPNEYEEAYNALPESERHKFGSPEDYREDYRELTSAFRTANPPSASSTEEENENEEELSAAERAHQLAEQQRQAAEQETGRLAQAAQQTMGLSQEFGKLAMPVMFVGALLETFGLASSGTTERLMNKIMSAFNSFKSALSDGMVAQDPADPDFQVEHGIQRERTADLTVMTP